MQNNEFKLNQSKIFVGLSCTILLITLCVISTFSIIMFLGCLAILLFFSWYLISYHALMNGNHIVRGFRLLDDAWYIDTTSETYLANLCGDSVVTRYISILNFKVAKQSKLYSCVIFPDSLPQDHYRQFVVWIRSQT